MEAMQGQQAQSVDQRFAKVDELSERTKSLQQDLSNFLSLQGSL